MKEKCSICQREFDIPITPEQIERWRAGELIQRVAPELDINLRELLISGLCGDCFDALMDEGEELT